jgi:hypothetical protein
MIYILTEQLMNGTVTMATYTYGVEAPDFEQAVLKIRDRLPTAAINMKYDKENYYSYVIPSTPGDSISFPVHGIMRRQVLKMIE